MEKQLDYISIFKVHSVEPIKPSNCDGTIRYITLCITCDTKPNDTSFDSLRVLTTSKIPDAYHEGFTTFEEYEEIPFRVITTLIQCNKIDDIFYLELDMSKPSCDMGITIDGYIGIDPRIDIDVSNFLITSNQDVFNSNTITFNEDFFNNIKNIKF